MAVFIIVGALLASVLTNDIVVVAMTPLLVSVTLSRGLNPIPFLLGFCFAANNGAAAFLIGSPKNMVVAQGLDLSFIGILNITAIPVLFSVPIVWCVITLLYRNRWYLSEDKKSLMPNVEPSIIEFNWWETIEAATVLFIVILAFLFSDFPRELVALSAACFLLLNRKIASSDMLKHVNGDLILLM
ncbi:SLC13 family permease [Providencia hangzhouensis]